MSLWTRKKIKLDGKKKNYRIVELKRYVYTTQPPPPPPSSARHFCEKEEKKIAPHSSDCTFNKFHYYVEAENGEIRLYFFQLT